MSLKEDVEVLRKAPLFQRVGPTDLKRIAFTSDRLAFEPGQHLMREGEMGDAAYLIIAGEADVLRETEEGALKVAEVGQNAFVGEIAILCDVPRTATITAKSRVETLKINKDTFFDLVSEYPQIAVSVMREIAERLDRTTGELSAARAQLKAAGG